ncbi:MAG: redox-regulated ATPase YchF [Ignavibacteriaceae bacterium]|nr:redox-regulated ATPase YchF [Ignavibacteriaceae bacterium]
MQIGLIGLQNSGKTVLFKTLLNSSGSAAQGKADQTRTVVKVPDQRLNKLTSIFNPKKQVNATLEIDDVAGLQVGDDGKIRITSDFLNKVKNCDALLHVVRQFENDAVPHPENSIDPLRDINFLETEFLFSDMAMIENRLEKIKKDMLKSKTDQLQRELPVFTKLQEHVNKELPIRLLSLDENEKRTLSGYQFLTLKPMIRGINFDENSKDKVGSMVKQIEDSFPEHKPTIVPFFAQFEFELSSLSKEEAEVFMQDFGITDSALDRILGSFYNMLGLQSFFTVGEDECRAWTITKGMTAQESAGVIHTDFYNKFIRAEVVGYEDFINHGSIAKCKDAGAWRLEGKEYIVKDGDILNIRHN